MPQLRLIALAGIIAWLALQGGGIGPAPAPDIDADGFYVLLVFDGDARDTITAGQGSVLNSARVADWVKSNSGEFRRYDAKDSLDAESPPWQEMRELAADPPQMIALKDGRASVQKIPDGIDATIRALERLK